MSKRKLVVNILEKGRKGVPIGTRVKVIGTDYYKEKTATGWKHVKVVRKQKKAPIINNKNNSTNTQANDGTQTQQVQGQVKRGRGRPRKDVTAVTVAPSKPSPSGRGRGRPRKVVAPVAPVVAKKIETKFEYKDANGNIVSVDLNDIKNFTKVTKTVDVPKTTKEPKAKAKPKKKVEPDTYPVGHRTVRVTASGKFYISEKQADGTWKYIKDASHKLKSIGTS